MGRSDILNLKSESVVLVDETKEMGACVTHKTKSAI